MRIQILLSLLLPAFSQAADRSITVTGHCIRAVAPDRGAVTLTAEARNADSKRAAREANQQYERLRERIGRLKLEGMELSTTEYSVEEVREWENNRQVSKGFRSRAGLKVTTTDLKRLGEALETAAQEGIKDIGRLTMFISPARYNETRADCLREATLSAKAKAQKVAEALGHSIGDPLNIVESGGAMAPPPVPMMERMSMAKAGDMGAPPQVEGGKEDIIVDVTATFGLK